MSAAKIDSAGNVTQLDGRLQPPEVFNDQDAQDPVKLARVVARLLAENTELRRRFNADRLDFEDVAVSTAGASVTLQHNFAGRVRWYLVGWQSSGTDAPILKEDTTNTTENTLVLKSYVAGTATIRVEEAGA